jgi:[ribosomal protein S5]-alanine N-acetyltransferase
MFFHFETERLRVTPLTIKDAGFILDLLNTEGWLKFIGDRNVHDEAAAQAYILRIMNRPGCFYHVVRLKGNDMPLGIVTFLKRDTQAHFDIGFAFLPQSEKNGYAFEATSGYLQRIIATGNHERVIAITLKENERSIGLLRKLGLQWAHNFEEAGEQMQLYAINGSGTV